MEIPKSGLRLNLGCGRHVLDGWYNIDAGAHPNAIRPPEMISDVKSIALPNKCATEIMAIHLWEHIYRWDCETVLAEWGRLMRPGARLVLEMPDLYKFCRNILEGIKGKKDPDQLGMWGMFGDPRERNPLMLHHWAWSFATLAPFLEQHGFTQCVEKPTEWHRVGQANRDFRIEALKS